MEFIDLKAQQQALKPELDKAIEQVLSHGQYIMGPEVLALEQSLAEFTGMKHCISCASGTDALQMVYMAYEIGVCDAVFAPTMTFIASVEPACMLGATPVFCDIDPKTFNISVESLEKQYDLVVKKGLHHPKAVVAVDFLGNPADYLALQAFCKEKSLLLIEDTAQGFGALHQGQPCGSFGDIATTSFFPAKPLGCYGDGGAIFTNDDKIAEALCSLRVHGKGSSKYDNVRIGVNSRLDTMQASILQVKFKAFVAFEIENRQKIANVYDEAFSEAFQLQQIKEGNKSIYAQYALLAKTEEQRDGIIAYLTKNNIPNMIYYKTPQHCLKVFEGNPYLDGDFSVAEEYGKRCFSIPFHPYLTEEEQNKIIQAVLEKE